MMKTTHRAGFGAALLLGTAMSLSLQAQEASYSQLVQQCFEASRQVAEGADLPPAVLDSCDAALQAESYLRQLQVPVEEWRAQHLRIYRAILLAESGFLSQALASYNDAMRFAADPAALFLNRANLHLYLGDYEAALADLEPLLGRDEFRARALYNRALVHHYAGLYLQAQDDFTALAQSYPAQYRQWAQNQDLRAIYPVELPAASAPTRSTAD